MDVTVQTALVGGVAAIGTVVIAEIGKRWKTAQDARAAEAAARVSDADAEVRTTDALGAAFRTITESLTIIHDLRDRLGKVEIDLLAARTEIEALQRANHNLADDKVALQDRLDQARGDIRQLKQVISSNASMAMPKLAFDDDST